MNEDLFRMEYFLRYVLPERLFNEGQEVLRGAAERATLIAKAAAPVDTGRLRRSIEMRQEGNDFVIGSAVPYAPYQEFGTRYVPARRFIREGAYRFIQDIRTAGYS